MFPVCAAFCNAEPRDHLNVSVAKGYDRTSSQKPGDELYAHFKANFANVVGQSSSSGSDGEVEIHTQTANNER